MKIPIIRAKILSKSKRDIYVTGYYMKMPAYTSCPAFDESCGEFKHYIATFECGDWGMPNHPVFYEIIDLNTIEIIGFDDFLDQK